MTRLPGPILLLIVLAVCLTTLWTPAQARDDGPYTTGFTGWRAASGGFASWQRSAVILAGDGTLRLDGVAAQPGTDPYPPSGYRGGNFYNGGSFFVGEASSPITTSSFGFTQAIASWNASTPSGTWIEMLARVRIDGQLTGWYNLGIWASDYSTIERHSVNLQGNAQAFVAVDTLILADRKDRADAFQIKVRFFTENRSIEPSLRNASMATSTTPFRPRDLTPGDPSRWNRVLQVPECSQMVYPDGGEVWCSPTSTSMVLAYWENYGGPCEPRVREAVDRVYDWLYDGHGNWPFNTAYAATHNMEGYVARFTSMAQAEQWIAAGVPVVISYAWKKNELTGAPIQSSNGHLAVLVGFDASGNPLVNDPAAPTDATVQRTYLREQLEKLWLEHSGGTAYLIYPPGWPIPSP